jgi:hypothetical protein
VFVVVYFVIESVRKLFGYTLILEITKETDHADRTGEDRRWIRAWVYQRTARTVSAEDKGDVK